MRALEFPGFLWKLQTPTAEMIEAKNADYVKKCNNRRNTLDLPG
ncbi:hypothetical protein BJP36_39985 [Moorena producens JHB]|uniref:Uncharacterized protein n=1 Tax=Moorena producens (strain JHB) TaxID=1454205 RepID=A0A9Q9SRX3_MOOP1|nr:hypothetical protein [Moorena producens]WAN68558.1 hypothetical protein BJP36_39985 [Moorena producens JHB]